jgi:hypothetical protein
VWSVPGLYKEDRLPGCHYGTNPCGGGVEYLHRDPASRRRRRKEKPQIWDSKMWSRVPRDSDPRKTALARTSSIYKRQTCPLVREGAQQNQDHNCQTVIHIWSWDPRLDRQSQCDFDFDHSTVLRRQVEEQEVGVRWWDRKQRIAHCCKKLPSKAVKTVTENSSVGVWFSKFSLDLLRVQ